MATFSVLRHVVKLSMGQFFRQSWLSPSLRNNANYSVTFTCIALRFLSLRLVFMIFIRSGEKLI